MEVEVHLDKLMQRRSLQISLEDEMALLVAFRQVVGVFQVMSKFRYEM